MNDKNMTPEEARQKAEKIEADAIASDDPNPSDYEEAARLFTLAGMTFRALRCLGVADQLRGGEQ